MEHYARYCLEFTDDDDLDRWRKWPGCNYDTIERAVESGRTTMWLDWRIYDRVSGERYYPHIEYGGGDD